ncbi:hypothetical protein PORY_000226 [Pneumocystis oryctolagi]|uniref:Uncharacterized protein n=1 Tax=Pneumocystis oryctolagi TaxID=42067 RepID=A0ACB7CF62_9ASCO|nr:hypothetical protein PORY_000226 [Pneumocystis oryctolagi]
MPINSLLRILDASIYSFSEENLKKKISSLKNSYDAVAYLINAYMLSLGFKLLGLGETHCLDKPITHSEIKPFFENVDGSKDPFYAFRYNFCDKEDIFLIKLLKMDKKLLIFGTKVGNDDTVSCDLLIDHYTRKDFFPYPNENETRSLEDAYISNDKITELINMYKMNVLHKLVPDLKDSHFIENNSYEKMPEKVFKCTDSSFRPFEEDVNSKFNKQPNIPVVHSSPFSIGDTDLHPPGIGPRPLISPRIGENDSLDRMNGCINGMYPDRNHPIYTRFKRDIPNRTMLPPGARYDPVTPHDNCGIGPGYLNNFSSRYRNIGEPDNDDFFPPGADNMYI